MEPTTTTTDRPTVGSAPLARSLASRDVQLTPRRPAPSGLAAALGWASVGLGLADLLTPGAMARLLGAARADRRRLRAVGARQLLTGLGILTLGRRGQAAALWGRVGGDLVDLALLGTAIARGRGDVGRLAIGAGVIAGLGALDTAAALAASRAIGEAADEPSGPVDVIHTVTIQRSAAECYRYWRRLSNLPTFMAHLESVTESGTRSTWVAKGPAGTRFEWQAELVEDVPDQHLMWRSLGGDVANSGLVRFAPAVGGRGTVVSVAMRYDVPGGAVGRTIARLLGREPSQQVKGDLKRFKQVLETGSVVHSDASIHAGPHPARPSRAGGAS